ncbi:ribbon-helix-helix domain-containing protein [Rhizobium pisi]|uniref:ribbon-helix-helix domain-containing protein n=1 Tax=Rhizobium pisi TaxID=574561 RepID=UPI0039B10871
MFELTIVVNHLSILVVAGGRFQLPAGLILCITLFMTKSTTVEDKKRGRGRPVTTGKTPITGVRIADEIGDALDKFAAHELDTPNRSEAIRRILRDWLSNHGYLPK